MKKRSGVGDPAEVSFEGPTQWQRDYTIVGLPTGKASDFIFALEQKMHQMESHSFH